MVPPKTAPADLQSHNTQGAPSDIRAVWTEAKASGQWHDWRWQFRNRVQDLETLSQLLDPTPDEAAAFHHAGTNLPFAITPYYMELIDPADPEDPIRKTMIPRADELKIHPHEMADPLGEDSHMPVPGLVHRYPDRVLFLVEDTCAVYCRYCTRSRVVGSHTLLPEFEHIYAYLEQHTEVRDVLISGGDPLIFSDDKIEGIIARLRAIPHIEVVRLGSKIPVVMPQRITHELVNRLKQYHPFFMSIHFLHPREITPEVTEACNRLADAGIPTFSQTVLLAGVNDDPAIMKPLMQKLLTLRVRPYYIYQCDPVPGTTHFRTSLQTGLQIMEQLRGHTTGYAVPTYVVDAPGGGGKIPVSPDYVVELAEDHVTLRNYTGKQYTYHFD